MSETVDLDRLDEWLSSDDSPENCMFLSDLDGFMHGIVCGPVMVSVEEWLPIALGGDPSGVPSWVLTDIATLHMEMVERLMSDDPHIEPLFWQAAEGHVIAMDWCEGFMDAVKLRAKEWLRLTESGEHGSLMMPILVHILDDNGNSPFEIPQEELDQVLADAADAIPDAVVAIYEFWRQRA